MKKQTILLVALSLISIIFATTMTVHTTSGNQEFEISEITGITFETATQPPVNMIFVEGGTFQMGDRFSEGDDDELPLHDVTVSDFYMAEMEITQADYEALIGENPSVGYGVGDNKPVYCISWYDAIDYCNALSIQEGLNPCYSGEEEDTVCDWNANGYRLPTEAEWEYAARGGIHQTDNYRYSGCHDEEDLTDFAWFASNSNLVCEDVGTKSANQLGLYDMSGNIIEWCWDHFDADYYSISPNLNPTGPEEGSYHILRSGYWNNYANQCRIADRGHTAPYYRNYYNGFRVARNSD
jgi:formylglycine-generating enzyme required for sulfatase activity